MSISGATRVYGLLGDPVAHSLSPRLCNDAFARAGRGRRVRGLAAATRRRPARP